MRRGGEAIPLLCRFGSFTGPIRWRAIGRSGCWRRGSRPQRWPAAVWRSKGFDSRAQRIPQGWQARSPSARDPYGKAEKQQFDPPVGAGLRKTAAFSRSPFLAAIRVEETVSPYPPERISRPPNGFAAQTARPPADRAGEAATSATRIHQPLTVLARPTGPPERNLRRRATRRRRCRRVRGYTACPTRRFRRGTAGAPASGPGPVGAVACTSGLAAG